MSCRINERRLWTHRIILEAMLHPSSVFCTLTYDDDHLPETHEVIGALNPDDTKNFLKRLRKVAPLGKIRYYLAGEYGDQTRRPHYHLILFNFPYAIGEERVTISVSKRMLRACDLIRAVWGKGLIELGTLPPKALSILRAILSKK